ncbi:mannosyltransferase [Ancylobacter aquaticus]|uniref:Mannosyltransferase n=1 Tax=Ancylobacter aquaticus TaxID=100 RepID=A0A4R1IDM9_ANCAQ|nr:glycosyltransferase family 4 protein [Ancylobacter aquaticus]TCK28822.1 mannosyltransferase [Ancylobacter aquaticus]
MTEKAAIDPARLEVVATNFKRRLSGVTSTLERVLPFQARTLGIAAFGPGLTDSIARIGAAELRHFWRRPARRPTRIWHARRNVEMLAGVVLRDLLRMKLSLVFTSASQRWHTRWSRFLISRMDAVIATSAKTAGYLQRPAAVIHHGIDMDSFAPAPDKAEARRAVGLPDDLRMIGCFGRIRAQKGTDVFVDALIRVLPDHPGWGGVVLGRATGAHTAFFADQRAKVEKAGLADRILFPGEVATSDIALWYRALDLYVAPQRWEGFGVTPLEAMACAVPVIATRVGAFDELVIEGQTGSIIPPGDVGEMAAAVSAFLQLDEAAAAAVARAARDHVVATHSIEVEAQKINAVYESVWASA